MRFCKYVLVYWLVTSNLNKYLRVKLYKLVSSFKLGGIYKKKVIGAVCQLVIVMLKYINIVKSDSFKEGKGDFLSF